MWKQIFANVRSMRLRLSVSWQLFSKWSIWLMKGSVFSSYTWFFSKMEHVVSISHFQNGRSFFKCTYVNFWPQRKILIKLATLKMVDFHFRFSDLTSDQSVFLLRTRIGTRRLYSCHIRTTNLVLCSTKTILEISLHFWVLNS